MASQKYPPAFNQLRSINAPAHRRSSTSQAPNRVTASDNRVDQVRDGTVLFRFEFCTHSVLMRRRGVAKNPHNFVLRKQPSIVHGKQERLADRQGGLACMFARRGHPGFPSWHREPGKGEVQMHPYFSQELHYAGLIQSSVLAGFRSRVTTRREDR